jgi:protein O-mannosyl-transferase
MPQQVKKSLVISIYLVLTVSALLVFWQIRNFDFVDYDDNVYVFENPHVLNGLTAESVWWAFTTGFAAFWHPLTWLSLILDCQLFGPGPAGFHIVNLLLHIANTLLLFGVLKKMTNSLWPSAFAAALFALHPLHVESVAWIAERKDVLSTFFWLLAMLAYARYVSRPSAVHYLLVLLIFALGLMAKPMLVTLPFVFLLLDYWPLERISRFNRQVIYRLVLEKIPFIVLAIASSIIAFLTQQSSGAISSFAAIPLKFRIGNALISYMEYIGKMIWPSRLAVYYPHPYENVSVLYAVISAVFLLIVTILVIRFAKLHRYLVTGWFWYLGTLIPVIGIIQVGNFAMADRYTYITLTGLFIIIAWGLPQLLSKWKLRKFVLALSMIIVLPALAITAHRQAGFWKDSLTVFSHAAQVSSNNWLAYYNLGVFYGKMGRHSEAIEACKQTIRIKPDFPDAYDNLGIAFGKLDRHAEAMEAFKQAIRLKPANAKAHFNLGVAYDNLSRFSESIDAYKQAVRIKPDYAEAHTNLAYAYLNVGDKNSALAEYNIIKVLNSQFADNLFREINK